MSFTRARRALTVLGIVTVSGLLLQGSLAHAVVPSDPAPPALYDDGSDGDISAPTDADAAGEADPRADGVAEEGLTEPVPDVTAPTPTAEQDVDAADGGAGLPLPEDPSAEVAPIEHAALAAAQRIPVAAAATPSAADEATILAEVNKLRLSYCQAIVVRNPAIDRVARNWAAKQLASGEYYHNPNYATEIPTHAVGAGENIYRGPADGHGAMRGWVASPGHFENMLSEGYSDIGIGFLRGPNWETYAIQVFGGYVQHFGGVFLDVRPRSKFYREINWMGTTKLSTGNRIPGCGKKVTYNPKRSVSREAMAAFLFRLDTAKFKAPARSPFADVQPGHKFYREITWMHARGISTGIRGADGKLRYAPQSSVSREAMAAFIYRYQNAKSQAPAHSPFADMKPGDRFYREISWMQQTGLSTGIAQPTGKAKYDPKSRVTREAMGAFIYRLKH